MTHRPAIGIIGGAGQLGRAIARRLALAGYVVILGSRDAQRAQTAATELCASGAGSVRGGSNLEAASSGEIVFVTVPFASQAQICAEIQLAVVGKVVVDTTVPLCPPKVMRVQLPPEGSAAQRAQRILGDGVTVVSAFHNVAAQKLAQPGDVDCDVLVFGDSQAARQQVTELVAACGMRGIHSGSLANSAAAEALTSVLIFVNKQYAVSSAGIRITGDLHDSRKT